MSNPAKIYNQGLIIVNEKVDSVKLVLDLSGFSYELREWKDGSKVFHFKSTKKQLQTIISDSNIVNSI